MISVLLPFRDAASTLLDAASSVLSDMSEDDELVLVDDGSRDDGPSVAAALRAKDRRVVCIASGGRGVARALACGLAVCRGEWIARMDADDVSLPERLACERAWLASDPSLGVVATRIELFGTGVSDGIRRYADWQNGLLSAGDHARSIFVESPVCHPSTMIRRAALESVGGFHDGPFAEDYDLWLRLVSAGWRMAKIPRVLFRWRIHERSVTWTDPRLSFDALRRLRARHLAKRIDRPFGVWGAGAAGRRLARELEANGARASFFLDIDPKKIGRSRRGVPVLDVETGLARAKRDDAMLVVAVAAAGARDIVRARLEARGFAEGPDFVCAA